MEPPSSSSSSPHLLPQPFSDGLDRRLGPAVEAPALRPVGDAVPAEADHVDDVAVALPAHHVL